MHINSLHITSFRNLPSGTVAFGNEVNIFYGKNGSGKTNLLEALFTLLLGRSQRGAPDAVILRNNETAYRLEGKIVVDKREYETAVAYQKGGRKKITVDSSTVRAADLFRRHSAVSTAPEDIEILHGGPSVRREFVNVYLSQASIAYLALLSDYQKALAQKNAFLKRSDNGAVNPFDDLIVAYGSEIILARREFINAITGPAAGFYEKIAGGHQLRISYKPSVRDTGETLDEIKSGFYKKLARYHDREMILQTSLVGPHRDEVEFFINEFPARAYGSQGELRTAALSLKMAVFAYLKKIRRTTPILLMDEIFAELDDSRQERLIEAFDSFGQLFLTTAAEIPKGLFENSHRYYIEDGNINAQ